MSQLPRDVAQTLITKLDLGQTRPIDAKRHAEAHYGVLLSGRTREQVIKSIGEHIAALPQWDESPEAAQSRVEDLKQRLVEANAPKVAPIITAQILATAMGMLAEEQHAPVDIAEGTLVDFDGQVWLCNADRAKLAFVAARHETLPARSGLGWVNLDLSQVPTDAEKAAALGWELEHTGGGCMAYMLELGVGGAYLLITDSDGCALPDDPANWAEHGAPLLSLYNEEGDELFGGVVGRPSVAPALELLRQALLACEQAGVTIQAQLDFETPEGCPLLIKHGDAVLWDAVDHGGQHYLNAAAVELAAMAVKAGQ